MSSADVALKPRSTNRRAAASAISSRVSALRRSVSAGLPPRPEVRGFR
jgi:hypothetical protein